MVTLRIVVQNGNFFGGPWLISRKHGLLLVWHSAAVKLMSFFPANEQQCPWATAGGMGGARGHLSPPLEFENDDVMQFVHTKSTAIFFQLTLTPLDCSRIRYVCLRTTPGDGATYVDTNPHNDVMCADLTEVLLCQPRE